MTNYEKWELGEMPIESQQMLISLFSQEERDKIFAYSQRVIIHNSALVCKTLFDLAMKGSIFQIEKTIEENKAILKSFNHTPEYFDVMNGKIGGYLRTPLFIEKGNIYFSILVTANLIKMLTNRKKKVRKQSKKIQAEA